MDNTSRFCFKVFYFLFSFSIQCTNFVNGDGCKFPKYSAEDAVLQSRIQPLIGKRYSVDDKMREYKYMIGICTDAVDSVKGAGVVQYKKKEDKFSTVIGKYTEAEFINGSDWLVLEYGGGDPYTSHCGSEPRKARIMITCDPSISTGYEEWAVIEEERNKTDNCYYLLEMKTSAVCKHAQLITVSLSIGTILVIVFICVTFLYLVLGFLYNRFVLGAKGKEQIPNYSFWQDFGNLQADGCNLVCRSGGSHQSPTYKGIGDDQLMDEEDRDDNLLPM